MAFSFDTGGVVPQPNSALKAGLSSHHGFLIAGSWFCTAVPCTLSRQTDLQANFELVTAAVLSTDSVYRTGLATAAAARWQCFKRVQAQYNSQSERHSLLPPCCVHPLQASPAYNKVETD